MPCRKAESPGCSTQLVHILGCEEEGCGRSSKEPEQVAVMRCLISTLAGSILTPSTSGVADNFPMPSLRNQHPETQALPQGCWNSVTTRPISTETSHGLGRALYRFVPESPHAAPLSQAFCKVQTSFIPLVFRSTSGSLRASPNLTCHNFCLYWWSLI